ncbi:hypothetical protein [Roseomonas haemaphysalidis]|uniref:DUF4412 domain-containing protein n=1 Tax=Roseomonas haemaphysalidis TaxID=2768162 RepID=A0ABS3KMF4_9PROT|nr:hypothetical protein [Roseomonas haemaphysalidis]MBO1078653.1 hypothetical protein [Roseomonas haemaphysalidis]
MIQRMAMALLAAAATAVPAMAQPAPARPTLLPTRDVAITYRLEGSDKVRGDIDASWSASQRLLRVDNDSAPGWVLVEERSRRASMVMRQGLVMRLPDSPEIAMLMDDPSSQGQVTRLGPRTVAGLRCTDWRLDRRDGKGGTACLTPDGVLLRLQQTGRREVLLATRVAYGAQDPARFRLPSGAPQITLPQGLRGLRLPGG